MMNGRKRFYKSYLNALNSKLSNIYCLGLSKRCFSSPSLYLNPAAGSKSPLSPAHSSKWKALCDEAKAVNRLLERSGISSNDQLRILTSALHTTSRSLSTSGSGGSGGPDPDPNDDKNKNKNNDDRKSQLIVKSIMWIFMVYLFVAGISLLFPSNSEHHQVSPYVSWNEFVHLMLSKGEVEEIVVRPILNIVTIFLHSGSVIKGKKLDRGIFHMNIIDVEQFEEKLRETEHSLGIPPDSRVPVTYVWDNDRLKLQLIAAVITGGIMFLLMRKFASSFSLSTQFQMGKAKYTMIDPLLPGSGRGVKFSDVAGAKEAKLEVMEFVDFLKNPTKYQKLGAKVPKGALLLGPPGCGKTLLAKAVATEGQVPFFAMNGSEFIEMIGGLGAARVRNLFKEAKKRAPCIVYIDEIDAIGRTRAPVNSPGSSQESEQTLNQLLVEMDGILSKEGVVLLASTNRLDILDKALMRPGRFDRHIMMDLPTLDERRQIFDHHLKAIVLEKPVSFYSRRMASLTLGFSGADIANVVNEAALYAARNAKKVVSAYELEYAVERVVGGTEKRSQSLSPDEKRVVAFHEAGHALTGWLLEHTDALLKVTIVPRTNQTLGFAQYAPKDKKLYAKEEIFEKMCMALGGRVAESLIFNKVTTSAQNDLEKVTKMAYAQVRSYGFSDVVGQVSFPDEETREIGKRPYSQKLTATIEEEVSKLMFKSYKSTEQLLKKNVDKLRLLAETLLQKETLNYEDVEAILGPPPHGNKLLIEPLEFENEISNWKEAGSQ